MMDYNASLYSLHYPHRCKYTASLHHGLKCDMVLFCFGAFSTVKRDVA